VPGSPAHGRLDLFHFHIGQRAAHRNVLFQPLDRSGRTLAARLHGFADALRTAPSLCESKALSNASRAFAARRDRRLWTIPARQPRASARPACRRASPASPEPAGPARIPAGWLQGIAGWLRLPPIEAGDGAHQQFPGRQGAAARDLRQFDRVLANGPFSHGEERALQCGRGRCAEDVPRAMRRTPPAPRGQRPRARRLLRWRRGVPRSSSGSFSGRTSSSNRPASVPPEPLRR
jgi:hypothetical protein